MTLLRKLEGPSPTVRKTQDLEQLGDQVPKVVPGVDLRELSIGPEEAFVFSRIDGRTSVKDIAITTGLPKDRVAQAVHTLQALGALEGGGSPSKGQRSSGKRAPSSSSQRHALPLTHQQPAPRAAGSMRVRTDELEERVDAMWSRLLHEDHYQLLGVARDADRKTIKAAYFEIIADFHPDKYYRQLNAELKGRVEVVFQKLTAAHETLTRGKKRAEYDATLTDSAPQRRSPVADVPPAPRPDIHDADLAPHAMTQPSIPKPAPLPGSVRTTIRTPATRPIDAIDVNIAGDEGRPLAPARSPSDPTPATQPRPDRTARLAHDMNVGRRSDNPAMSNRATVPAENSAAAQEAAMKFAAMMQRGRPSTSLPRAGGQESPTLRPTARPPSVTAQTLTAATRPTLRPSMAPPEPPEARINRYIKDAERHLREANAVAASNSLRLASSLAQSSGQSSGEAVQKLAALQREVDALLFDANLLSAKRHERNREWTNAGRYYAKAARGQHSGELYVQAARCYRQGGRKREALEQAQAAIGACPADSAAHELLGHIYEETGEIARAIAQLEKALSLKPDDDAIKSQIARLKRGKTGV